jgi:hypothetical protein
MSSGTFLKDYCWAEYMSFWHYFYADAVQLTSALAPDEKLVHDGIQYYCSLYPEKRKAILEALDAHDFRILNKIHIMLANELALLSENEDKAEEIVRNLEALRYQNQQEDIERLYSAMNYRDSREKYAYELIRHLHDLLKDESRTIKALESSQDQLTVEKLSNALREQLDVEKTLIDKIRECPNFYQHYVRLAQGARIKHEIKKDEQHFADQVHAAMMEFENPTTEDPLALLTRHCLSKVEQEAYAAAYDGRLSDLGTYTNFEFVNSHYFEEFVRSEIKANKFENIIDQKMMHRFIIIFRDIYNYDIRNV